MAAENEEFGIESFLDFAPLNRKALQLCFGSGAYTKKGSGFF